MPLFGTLGRRKRPTVTPEVEWNLKTVDLGGLHASRSMVELATELGVRYEPAEVEDRKTPPTSPGKARVNGQYDSHKCAPLFHSSRQLASSLTWAKPSSMHQSPLVTRSEDGHSVYSRRSTMDPRHSTVSSPGVTSPRKRIRQSTQTFNILVVGPRNVGKTSFIRTLLKTLTLSHGAAHAESLDQIATFESRSWRRTRERTIVTVEAMERGERVQVTFIDTPGLDAGYGDALEADRAVSGMIVSIEARFEYTLQHESQVIRSAARSSEAHIHACIYFLAPTSFATRDPTEFPPTPATSPKRARSVKRSHSSPQLSSSNDRGSDETQRPVTGGVEDVELLELRSLDLRLIKRLSQRVNVIPVIARADELTSSRLAELKAAVARGLRREGLSYGVLDHTSGSLPTNGPYSPTHTEPHPPLPTDAAAIAAAAADTLEAPIPLIRTRSRSKSVSRKRSLVAEDEVAPPDTAALQEIMPFALLAPEDPAKGYTRTYKWGSIDTLNPEHCDFLALKQVLFNTHMKAFKDHTRRNLYEAFRTEKLLHQRASASLSTSQREKLARDLKSI